MFVVCNYWNINSIYICCNAHVYMHMTVYICIVGVRSRAHVCVNKHYTVADVSSATLFALLRGPSVHVGLEAKKCLLAFCPRRAKGQSARVGRSSPAFPSSGLITLKFALTDSALSSRLKCSLHLCC